jgi:SAM-dependent methyltransferase
VSTYLFEHTWDEERRRLALLEEVFDAASEDYLGRIPIPVGGSCLEVGAGAGSIAGWFCDRVGPEGRVVATDLEPEFLEQRTEPNLEVRRHNIVTDDLETDTFDVIHSRLVLEHIAERDQVLRRLVAALRPGGWLVQEDFDWCSLVSPPGCRSGELAIRGLEAFRVVFEAAGADPYYGRRLPLDFRAAGLVDVGAEGRVHVALGGTAAAAWWQVTLAKMCEPIAANGSLSEAEVAEILAACDDPGFSMLYPTIVTVWGRRPE